MTFPARESYPMSPPTRVKSLTEVHCRQCSTKYSLLDAGECPRCCLALGQNLIVPKTEVISLMSHVCRLLRNKIIHEEVMVDTKFVTSMLGYTEVPLFQPVEREQEKAELKSEQAEEEGEDIRATTHADQEKEDNKEAGAQPQAIEADTAEGVVTPHRGTPHDEAVVTATVPPETPEEQRNEIDLTSSIEEEEVHTSSVRRDQLKPAPSVHTSRTRMETVVTPTNREAVARLDDTEPTGEEGQVRNEANASLEVVEIDDLEHEPSRRAEEAPAALNQMTRSPTPSSRHRPSLTSMIPETPPPTTPTTAPSPFLPPPRCTTPTAASASRKRAYEASSHYETPPRKQHKKAKSSTSYTQRVQKRERAQRLRADPCPDIQRSPAFKESLAGLRIQIGDEPLLARHDVATPSRRRQVPQCGIPKCTNGFFKSGGSMWILTKTNRSRTQSSIPFQHPLHLMCTKCLPRTTDLKWFPKELLSEAIMEEIPNCGQHMYIIGSKQDYVAVKDTMM